MTNLRTALNQAIDAGDAGRLTAAGFGELEADEIREAMAAMAATEPVGRAAALLDATEEADIDTVLASARAGLAAAAAPTALGADLIAGADADVVELDFAPLGAAPAEPEPFDGESLGDTLPIDDEVDDLDFGAGGQLPDDSGDPLAGLDFDDADEPTPFDEPSAVIDDVTDDEPDPFAIGTVDLDHPTDLDADDDDDHFL